MKVQQSSNNQQSFGMALKVKKSAMKRIIKYNKQDNFFKELPGLKELAKKYDIVVSDDVYYLPDYYIGYTVTPLNKLGVSNGLTRFISSLAKKGHFVQELSSEPDVGYIRCAQSAIEDIETPKVKVEKSIKTRILEYKEEKRVQREEEKQKLAEKTKFLQDVNTFKLKFQEQNKTDARTKREANSFIKKLQEQM